ncbi:MAG: hypothetical protein ACT4R6_12235 [Gemmatimonadaceae bacterium]
MTHSSAPNIRCLTTCRTFGCRREVKHDALGQILPQDKLVPQLPRFGARHLAAKFRKQIVQQVAEQAGFAVCQCELHRVPSE